MNGIKNVYKKDDKIKFQEEKIFVLLQEIYLKEKFL
jgi:hypothetical protein